MTELEHAIKHIKTRADAWAVKEVTDALRSISERLEKALSQEPICDRDCEHCTWTECPIEPCDDTVSIRKDALKTRVGNIVAYNVEWLKKHWQMEMDIVCGVKPCDDAISREWLMRKATERFYTTNYFNHISAMIEEAPSVTQKSGEWIPVSERLPKKYGEYLITWTGICGKQRSKPLIGIAEYEIYEPENYEDWITTDNEFRHYHNIKVLAWQELPEPYMVEPQESEDKE